MTTNSTIQLVKRKRTSVTERIEYRKMKLTYVSMFFYLASLAKW